MGLGVVIMMSYGWGLLLNNDVIPLGFVGYYNVISIIMSSLWDFLLYNYVISLGFWTILRVDWMWWRGGPVILYEGSGHCAIFVFCERAARR